ncbi:MAG TPA: OstA-like protein [Prolixibacteraceae bacterium]|nr:OstA-like protein [Prolixibacteraceae bacterium]
MKRSFLKRLTHKVFFVLGILLLASGAGFSQTKKKVEILHTDAGGYNERIVANAQRLIGNVQIRVDGATMWCDSLYSYSNVNSVDAFGNVHIVRGDTLNMYADFINYNGDTKIAKARRNVKLIDKTTILTTDSLDYDMPTDLAYYNHSGTVKDSANVLTSLIGQFHVNENKAYFRTNVEGTTKDYKIKSDTLIYYTNIRKVYIEGPTYIYNEKDTLYSEYGWYDSIKNLSNLTKNPRIWNIEQNIKADSILYDKMKGEGLALGNARLEDIENKMIVQGNRVEYNDISKIAMATDSAMFIQYSDGDSLFMHAEILKTIPDTSKFSLHAVKAKLATPKLIPDNLAKDSLAPAVAVDSTLQAIPLKVDSLATTTLAQDTTAVEKPKDPRLVLAYNKVRFFREDMQGKCDSLVYWSKDSTIQLFTDPVIWNSNNQITADYIEMINRTKDPDEVHMENNAFIISMEADSLRFNQIKGRNMIGFIRKNELYKVDVNGNGQSNYYVPDKKGLIGLNKAESSNITIYLNKGKVSKIVLIKSPDGELKPMAEIDEGDKILPGFNWLHEIRPKSKLDIFRTSEVVKVEKESL